MDDNQENKQALNEDTVFFLRVQFRRNTSWQGTLQCLTTREICVFRSVLELGSLMQEAITMNSGTEGLEKAKFITWNDKESVS